MDMTIQEILAELELLTEGEFPREALQQAIAQREQIIPELLNILEYVTQHIEEVEAETAYMAHLYAMYLLAQFREPRAYPLIVDFFSIPGEVTLDITGDFLTEDLGRVLASVSGGNTGLMKRLIEDEHVNEYVRDAAMRGILALVARGDVSRDEAVAYFQSLFRGGLEREFSLAWSGLVSCSCDLHAVALLDDIRQAFEDELVDEFFIDLEWVEEVMQRDHGEALAELKEDRHLWFVEDTIKEMGWWACFQPPKPRFPAIKAIMDVQKKVGRNDPCPCGSGKKYKKCCGAPK